MDIRDKKEALIKRVSQNIQYIMENKGVSQTDLINSIKEKRNLDISQPYLSRIINGNIKNIPALPVVAICEALNEDIQKIFWEKLDTSTLLDQKANKKESKLVYVSKDDEFETYIGRYHCYFYPTISDEVKKGILYGELEFSLHPHTKECVANFTIHMDPTENAQDKKYQGKLILSSSYNCCFCYLVNDTFGEISFLMFKGFSANIKKLSCRMVAVITPSAGGTRDATFHRMFISRRKLSNKGIDAISPHLKMNSSEIIISDEELENLFCELNVPQNFNHTIKSLTTPDKFYVLREEHFWGFNERNMESYNKMEFITAMRNRAHTNYYQKIGKKVDDMLYAHIYKSPNKEIFFEDQEENKENL